MDTGEQNEYRLIDRPPSVEDYCRLRQDCGLSEIAPEAAQHGLRGTWFGVTVMWGDQPIGMGRIVGDGGCFFLITDMAVHPDHQRRGIGRRIMKRLTDELDARAPATAFVHLFADGTASKLYEQFGFRPAAPRSHGMQRRQ